MIQTGNFLSHLFLPIVPDQPVSMLLALDISPQIVTIQESLPEFFQEVRGHFMTEEILDLPESTPGSLHKSFLRVNMIPDFFQAFVFLDSSRSFAGEAKGMCDLLHGLVVVIE